MTSVTSVMTFVQRLPAKAFWQRLLKISRTGLAGFILKNWCLHRSGYKVVATGLLKHTSSLFKQQHAMLCLPGSWNAVGGCQTIPDAWQEVKPYRGKSVRQFEFSRAGSQEQQIAFRVPYAWWKAKILRGQVIELSIISWHFFLS